MFVIGLLEVKSLRILPGRAAFGLFAVLSVGGVLAAVRCAARLPARGSAVLRQRSGRAVPRCAVAAVRRVVNTVRPRSSRFRRTTCRPSSPRIRAIALLPGETVLRRYAALQALAGREADALDTVARLHVFAKELKDWPQQLAALYARSAAGAEAVQGGGRREIRRSAGRCGRRRGRRRFGLMRAAPAGTGNSGMCRAATGGGARRSLAPARTRRFRPRIDYLADCIFRLKAGDSRQPLSNRRRLPGWACTMRERSRADPCEARAARTQATPGHPGSPPRRIAAEHRSAVRP